MFIGITPQFLRMGFNGRTNARMTRPASAAITAIIMKNEPLAMTRPEAAEVAGEKVAGEACGEPHAHHHRDGAGRRHLGDKREARPATDKARRW